MLRKSCVAIAAIALGGGVAQAEIVTVTVTGDVVFNGIANPPLSGVTAADTVEMSFEVDSNVFVDGIPGDVRSYPIDQSSFSLRYSPSGVTVGLANPFPAGQTPYFSLVDGFPVSDGFFVSTSTSSPGGVPLSQSPVQANLDLGYEGSTLSSLNILDAVGTYGFGGLTRFSFTLWQVFPDNTVMEMDFASMTIVPEPATFGVSALTGLAVLARRRRSAN